jgi:energy-coupling factor transporter ATP-binding protein EcfA2
MAISPMSIRQYHVFLASPGDVNDERQMVRQFFEHYNQHTAQLWGVRFEVIDWENYATIGVGRPQELITAQTLERFRNSLALVIGIMGQRFGSPTGKAESGTEEEFNWALQSHQQSGFPEIKWFFRRIDRFIAPPDPDEIEHALEQWKKVRAFRERLQTLDPPVFYAEYPDATKFRDVFESDLSRWLAAPVRPWVENMPPRQDVVLPPLTPPMEYYRRIEGDFHRLDIAGIDNDRAFELPLSEIYVRLRVMFDEDAQTDAEAIQDSGPLDVQTALLRYPKLVIVGDPGSGKSTFLKYIALMIARSVLQANPNIALEALCLQVPLPIPLFVSCWDLSDFLRKSDRVDLPVLLEFLTQRLEAYGFRIQVSDLEKLLESGSCCLLFDGLDEVPTEQGRAVVSRLLDDCVRRFSQNRFVVTSRIRAYTGDTILQGEFIRCDIQPFDENDRRQFLRNWVALLFKIPREQVLMDGTEARREFDSLSRGIESNDRIRPLAVNPLLLTVIAIVHWNRKRLPEQRVDLYDECVDVLLGQRKEAERVQANRRVGSLDETQEERQYEERAWVRKRFAEIAIDILGSDEDEVTKGDVVKLLTPRFRDQGAINEEQAIARAELFLDRQELRSGLLVSRRSQSYRFVHLTFQEYLAAWHLSNQEVKDALQLIQPHLRRQKWFEVLQLLGAEWAKQSDEKLDRYLAWLLEQQGTMITDRAPVVALCANIVKDASGVAELKPQTRQSYRTAVQDTLAAFRPRSGVPDKIQLEILEALGQLGAAVKPHLIDATKSGLFAVRRRAIEMLLPHLSDDELFSLNHILSDRSKEPIKTFLIELLERDAEKTTAWLLLRKHFQYKACEAVGELIPVFAAHFSSNVLFDFLSNIFRRGDTWGRGRFLGIMATQLKGDVRTWQLIRDAAIKDPNGNFVRREALQLLASRQREDPTTWQLIREAAMKDTESSIRREALELQAKDQKDDPTTWQLIREAATKDRDEAVRATALALLSRGQKDDPIAWQLIRSAAMKDPAVSVRSQACGLLLSASNCDELHQRMMRINLDEKWGRYDPKEPITSQRIAYVAQKLAV